MSSSVSEAALARMVGEALAAGGSEQLDRERAYVMQHLAGHRTDLTAALEELSAGVSPYHVVGRYRLPGSDVSIETHRAVMPPGSMTDDVIGIIREVSASVRPRTVLDLGSGTGILGIGALVTDQRMRGVLLDIDDAAAACSGRNLARAGLTGRARALRSDGGRCLRPASVELLIANLPFVADSEMHTLPVRFSVHTPRPAVCGGGSDGLNVLRQLAPSMEVAAAATCRLVLQIGDAEQKAAAAGLLAAAWEPVAHGVGRHPNVLVAVRRPG